MSANADSSESSGREVARRLFAREFTDATYTFKESDDELAPNYTLLPTGERLNRLFVAGTLTETSDVGSDSEYWQGRVVGPTGTFYVYAGQYQPEAASTLRQIETPTYVTVVGKPRSYETDDGDTNVAIRPESITQVDEPTRDRWVNETAEQTIERLQAFENESNAYAQMARKEYDGMLSPYREAAIEALESLDATTGSPPTTNSGGESEDTQPDASASDSFAGGDTEQVESADLAPESDDLGDSDDRDATSPGDSSGREESFEDTTLGEDE
jgi:RPA family protein